MLRGSGVSNIALGFHVALLGRTVEVACVLVGVLDMRHGRFHSSTDDGSLLSHELGKLL